MTVCFSCHQEFKSGYTSEWRSANIENVQKNHPTPTGYVTKVTYSDYSYHHYQVCHSCAKKLWLKNTRKGVIIFIICLLLCAIAYTIGSFIKYVDGLMGLSVIAALIVLMYPLAIIWEYVTTFASDNPFLKRFARIWYGTSEGKFKKSGIEAIFGAAAERDKGNRTELWMESYEEI